MLPQILPRQRTSKQARKYDRLGERTRHQSKLVLHATLLRGLIAQDYAPFVVRVALAMRSHITIPTNQMKQMTRWCVARPASPYPLTFMHVAAIFCIAALAIVLRIIKLILITTNPDAPRVPRVPAPPIGTLMMTRARTFQSTLTSRVRRQRSRDHSFHSRPPTCEVLGMPSQPLMKTINLKMKITNKRQIAIWTQRKRTSGLPRQRIRLMDY